MLKRVENFIKLIFNKKCNFLCNKKVELFLESCKIKKKRNKSIQT